MITNPVNAASAGQSNSYNRITVSDIVQLSEFSGLDVCSDENLIAVRVDNPNIAENQTSHNWVIIEWPSGEVRLKANAGETINSFFGFENVRPQWSPDCEWIYYRARKAFEVQIWRLNARSGQAEKVSSDDSDVLAFELSKNGRELIYKVGAARSAISAAERREYERGVLYDESIFSGHPPLMRTYPATGRWGVYRRWDSHTMGHLLSRQSPSYKVLRIADREARIATESQVHGALKEEPQNIDWIKVENAGVTIAPSGEKAVVKIVTQKNRYDDPSITTLASISRDAPSKIQKCSIKPCTSRVVEFLKWSNDGSTLYFLSEQTRGAAGIYAWLPHTDDVHLIFQSGGTLGALASSDRYKSMSCPIMSNIAFCTSADHDIPPKLLAINLESGDTAAVYDPNADLRNKFKLRTERIRWMDGFERKALGILVYPRGYKAGERYPLVITAHTCRGFLSGGTADGGPEYALAESKFFVLCVDRSSPYPPVEDTLKYSPGPRRFVAMVSEFETAIEMLAEKGFIDGRGVGISGMSESAKAISYALTHSNSFVVAAVRGLGVISPESEILSWHPSSTVHKTLLKVHNIAENGHNRKVVFDDLAMTRRAGNVNAPVLVQANENEYLLSLPAVHALLKHDKPVELHIFPDETHILFQPKHRFVNFTRNLDWFRFWLQGYEDPDPEKADQYARWRKMRSERCAWDEPKDEKPSYCEYSNAVH